LPADVDLAVFILDTSVTGTEPARLPTAGLLDEVAREGGLVGATFDVVGYALRGFEKGGGPPQPIGPPQTGVVQRQTATSRFKALTHDVLNPEFWRSGGRRQYRSRLLCSINTPCLRHESHRRSDRVQRSGRKNSRISSARRGKWRVGDDLGSCRSGCCI
jgi:hypothetical protein